MADKILPKFDFSNPDKNLPFYSCWVHVFGSSIEYKLFTKEIRYLLTLLMLFIENLCVLHLFVKNNNSTYAVEKEQTLTHVTTTRNSTKRNQSIH